MNTKVINLKVDAAIKRDAQRLAEQLGFSLSSVVKAYLRHFIKTQTLHFSAATEAEEPSKYLIKMLAESDKDIKEGFVSPPLRTSEEAEAWLNDPNARYANGSPVQ